jgi:multiple sugar transport system substrate-binding protein
MRVGEIGSEQRAQGAQGAQSRSRRAVLRGIGGLAGLAGLAGCVPGGGGQDGAESGASRTKEPFTLRVHTRSGGDLDRYMVSRKADFEALVPHARLEIEVLAPDPVQYATKVLVAHSAGELGDAAWSTSRAGYAKQLAARGVFAPLEPLARAERFALNEYYPNALGEATWDGKLYSLPHITEPGQVGLMWNKNLFAGTNVRPPTLGWTYNDLRVAATELSRGPTDAREQLGYAGSYGALGFLPLLRAFGGDLLSADGTRCVLDTPQALAAVQWQHDLIQRQFAAPAPGKAPAGGFNGGKIAMQPIWPVAIKAVPLQLGGSFEVASTMIPTGPGGEKGTMLNSHTMGVVKTSKHPDEAWAWVKWSCGRDYSVHRVLSGNGGPAGRPDAWRNEQVLREIPEWKDWADLMDRARPNHIPANLRGQELEAAFDQHTGAIWRGELGPADGIKQTTAAVQEVLRLPSA